MILYLSAVGMLAWVYLWLFHGKFWKILLPKPAAAPTLWPRVDVIVPARDGAETLPESLPSLLAQDYPGEWRVILVDDHSADGTADIARRTADHDSPNGHRLTIIQAPEFPPGWTEKLSAMQAGVAQSNADLILFTDADIKHHPQNLSELVARAQGRNLDLVSLMVKLNCWTLAEKLLIPAFVFFFAILYPFRWINDRRKQTAAAAGGVMLVRRATLDKCGGLARIKNQLIDDCALAQLIKGGDGRIELTLTQDVKSLRIYHGIGEIWHMIARTAYTQLDHSILALLFTIAGMVVLFFLPAYLTFNENFTGFLAGIGAWIMITLYWPMLRFYKFSYISAIFWSFMLPVSALIYLAATIDSAFLYWQGKGGEWRGRIQG